MTLFHLYAAYDIVPTQPLRYIHVAFVMVLAFLLFPIAARFRNRIRWLDVVAAAAAVVILAYALWGGEDFTDRATVPDRLDVVLGVIFIVLLLEATRRTTGLIMPIVALAVHRLCDAGTASAAAVDASRLRRLAPGRASVHHARGDLRRRRRRLGDAHHHVHHLWRVPAAFWRRQVLHRFLHGADGRQAQQRRAHGGAVVVPARRALRLRRRDDGDHRRRRLPDDGARRLREERGRRAARGRRARRHPVAAGARRRRVPDRRVSEDQLSRRDLDGDDPDLPLLPVAPVHGRARRQALRRHRRARTTSR